MTRSSLRLAALVLVLAATFWLTLPLPSHAAQCSSGNCSLSAGTCVDFVNCTKTCCGSDVTTIFSAQGADANSCLGARNTCTRCLPACPAGQTPCGSSVGLCMF